MAITLSKTPANIHPLNFDSHDSQWMDLDDFNPTEFNRCITTESNYNNLKK